MLRLLLKRPPTVPLEAEVICPDVLSKLSAAEVRSATVYHGKRQCRLDEFFDIEGDAGDDIEVHGDLSKVRWIGREMSRGTLAIHGDVGMHLGSRMLGGAISVTGDASDWVGAEMKNGTIRIQGNAGGQIGGAYRGALSGMKNGTILIGGTAGLEVGIRMRRGTIVVGGLVRDFAGLQMKGGTIVLLSGAEIRTGAWMNRGTIISLKPLQLMPTFRASGISNPTIMNIYARHLKQFGLELPYRSAEGAYARYTGDSAVPGKGEIFIWQPTHVAD
jgi:formylmethanofuran dehydrogenase subunit C